MIYLDNAATAIPNGEAVKQAEKFLTQDFYNPSSLYRAGFSAHKAIEDARKFLLSRIASPANFELIFTGSGSEGDNQALFCAAGRGNVVTTSGEHAAVYNSTKELSLRGTEVRYARLNADGSVDIDDLLSKVDEKTTLVSVIHVNNETGAVNDVNTLAAEGYDGLFLSHGGREYSHSLISSVLLLYPQLSIVTFDTELIGPEGEPEAIDGVTQFFQDDRELATILLDFIIEEVAEERPARILKLWVPDYIAAFDRRNEGYEAYEESGLIDTVAVVSPSVEIDPELAAYRAMMEALKTIDEGDVDAIWAAYDAYGRGCYRALAESGKDIPMVSVDISEGDMSLMAEPGSLWLASACTDFRANGEQGMRILALEMADEYESIPSAWIEMGASLITQEDLPGEGESLSDTAPSSYGDPSELVTSPWIRDAIGY